MVLMGQAVTGELSADYIWRLSLLATCGLVIMWVAFWIVVRLSRERVSSILLNPAFFRTIAVMGVIAATVVLSLAGRIEGNLTGAVLSGIVGYVLGTKTGTDAEAGVGKDVPPGEAKS
ncbi:MAG TPA: hypothetical protein VG457_08515 [Planctomycetota bacterium]|jgi:glucan phosphoethanolaminetransferase (alkaline phosphatase superfamily)|nr:hypothetical protein [Planctomycetota bacterium]